MKRGISLSVVVLAYDEEAALERVVLDLLAYLPGRVEKFEIIIVDDGSRDGTAAICSRLAAGHPAVRAITHAENRGLPRAAKTGYREARCAYVIWIEGDGQFLVPDLERFLELVPRHTVVASWRQRRDYSLARRCVSAGYNFLLSLLFDLKIRDAGSVIMLKRGIVDEAELISDGVTVSAELLLRAKGKGHDIGQCPRTFVPRMAGTSRIFGLREILHGIGDLLRLYRSAL
ncbi:MAG: glycosyltransferase family 2 protein [Elusimicrobiota bacterium]